MSFVARRLAGDAGQARRTRLAAEDKTQLAQFSSQNAELATVRDLAHAFTDLVRNRTAAAQQRLDAWITTVKVASIPSLISFANGLDRDRDAIIAGFTTGWSSRRVEGTVNRI